jgi:hypothetical protein
MLYGICEASIAARFAPAQKNGREVGKTKRGKGTKITALADRNGRFTALHLICRRKGGLRFVFPLGRNPL